MRETAASLETHESPYDAVAEFYRRAWADWYLPSIRPFLHRFLFSALTEGACVLDACCGCGHVTREVSAAGFPVTGIDSSKELIERAREEVSGAMFVVGDVRNFKIATAFDGALSTFDSLNHLLDYSDLCAAFACIQRALKSGAPFIFDMNLEAAYAMDLGAWTRYSDDDSIGFVKGRYDPVTKRGKTELIWFHRAQQAGYWLRSDAFVEEQCYSREEIEDAVRSAGFKNPEYYFAADAGVTDELGYGRLYARVWA